jgi:hypothetical protein
MVACDAVLGANFHGGNTGSNPVGDANKINNLAGVTTETPRSGDAVVTD